MVVWRWNLEQLSKTISGTLLNKFDFFLVIEGKRGLGKSTLGFKIMKQVHKQMKLKQINGYKFTPKTCLLYRRKEALKFFTKRNATAMADEMINVTFNRDFYNEDQKDLIKIINMNRDHCNLFIACVPQFANLDSQIRNLCKMRITVVRRGVAIIQTPNHTIYSPDIWDSRINEKIEREWVSKKVKNPKYSKLTTFRGIIKFSKLSDGDEKRYQKIKDIKRNVIETEKNFMKEHEELKPVDVIINKLIDGKIRNMQVVDGFAFANDDTPSNFASKVRTELKNRGVETRLDRYFWEKKKEKTKEEQEEALFE